MSIVLETDRPNPSLEQAEVPQAAVLHPQVRYVTSQVPGGKLALPEDYLHLDGGRRHTLDHTNTNTVL